MKSAPNFPHLSQLTVLTNTWLSELAFIDDELRFCKKNLNHWTLFLNDESFLDGLQKMKRKLVALEEESKQNREKVKKQLHLFHNLFNGQPENTSTRLLEHNHEALEKDIQVITSHFRSTKSQFNSLSKRMLQDKQITEH